LDSGGFVQDDTIFIKVALSSPTNLDWQSCGEF
jgi:hypothetical protein